MTTALRLPGPSGIGRSAVATDLLPGVDVAFCRLRVGRDEPRARFVGRGWQVGAADGIPRRWPSRA